MPQIDELLATLANARNLSAAYAAEKREMIDSLKQSDEYKAADDGSHFADETILNTEAGIRMIALTDYGANLNKHPHEKIEIKIFSVVDIPNPEAAREWCFKNFRPALNLDTKKFEKAAKDGSIPAELVKITEELRVQISSKL